ncbi:hypothetical protein K227x_17150 [Rubripirellula lacrimiformis]|uniref:Uncharacterized protein n=1 Tax=Rubripirellula lacrimiformis TaxID=1930273 RepID=A0A517N866_9BACT|nr:hypothetical protein [Rubripirellula lacrimiformis]QDT03333.1 hypothetical protein K227x_17150 [Rubripirellula lacrimiformis]
MNDRPTFALKRFSIAALLFAIFCSAGAFLGFRYGMSKGVDAQVDQRLASLRSQVYPVSYRVADLTSVASQPGAADSVSAETLAGEIKSTVAQDRWDDNGGPCVIRAMKPTMIVVNGSAIDHDIVQAYLEGRRKAKADEPSVGSETSKKFLGDD